MAVTLSHCSFISRRVFKSVANSHYWPPHVCPYVCLHVSQRLTGYGFSWNFILDIFIKLCVPL